MTIRTGNEGEDGIFDGRGCGGRDGGSAPAPQATTCATFGAFPEAQPVNQQRETDGDGCSKRLAGHAPPKSEPEA